jgi:hypothetical protein
MYFRPANLERWLSVAGTVMVAVSFAQAQTLMQPGQAIVFSTPDSGDADATAPTTALQPAEPSLPDLIHAPEINFKNPPATSPRQLAPTTSAAPAPNPRANWWMLTPAEILGVTTPEQILKIPERDAAGQRKNPTDLERLYERQDQMPTNGVDGFFSKTPFLRGVFSDDANTRLSGTGYNPASGGFANPERLTDPFQSPAPGNGTASGQNGNAGWSKIFISPATPAQSPAQAADMAEFQKLLEPNEPAKLTKSSTADGFFPSHQTSPESVSIHPASASGASFGDFNNGISGLPGFAGQAVVPTVTTVPDWKPQPPPWMLKGPQSDKIPKRVVF